MRKLMIGVLTLVVVGCMSATAFAGGVKATSEIQEHNAGCGNNEALPKAGTAKLTRKVNSVSITYKLAVGDPEEVYTLELWNATGGACEEIGVAGKFTTNAKGKGTGKGTITVPQADSEFFATGIDSKSGFSDALTVKLP
jgi:hypothetical protein